MTHQWVTQPSLLQARSWLTVNPIASKPFPALTLILQQRQSGLLQTAASHALPLKNEHGNQNCLALLERSINVFCLLRFRFQSCWTPHSVYISQSDSSLVLSFLIHYLRRAIWRISERSRSLKSITLEKLALPRERLGKPWGIHLGRGGPCTGPC